MVIQEFKKQLVKLGIGPGAKWRKVDLHVHMPESAGYEYKQADACEQLGRALAEAELDVAVILKHQEMPTREELQRLGAHCPRTSLIPGAEINVLVDALFKKIGKDYFFHCIVAADPQQERDFGYVLERAKEKFTYRTGEYPAGFRSSVTDLGKFFQEQGALFIPAHLHQGKDPANSRSIDDLYDDDAFLGFVREGAFTAIEVRQSTTAAFFDGARKTNEGLIIPRSVCVASSDAHHHMHIAERNRCTWIRTENTSFTELAAALSFPHRVALTQPKVYHHRVLGLHVVGAFIPECWLILNEGLNALIGSKGTGKTALLECLRFVLCTHIPTERADSVRKHINHILGSSGYVECLVTGLDGTERLITRRADSPDRINIIDLAGASIPIKASDGPGFPISILGWHEIEAVADKATARIGLLDRVGDPNEIRRLRSDITAHIERARDLMPLLQREIKHLDAILREFWSLQVKRDTLQRLEQADLVSLQRQYEWFLLTEQKLVSLQDAAVARRTGLPEFVTSHLPDGISGPPDTGSAGEALTLLSTISELTRGNAECERDCIVRLDGSLEALDRGVSNASTSLAVSFTTFREMVYTPKINSLPQEDREILAKQIQVLEDTKRLPVVEQQAAKLLRTVKDYAEKLYTACDAVCSCRDAIARKRQDLITQLNEDLPNIRLEFLRSANHEARDRFQSRHGADAGGLLGYIETFGGGGSYERLRALFAKLRNLDLIQENWQVQNTLWDVKMVDLFDVLDEDDVQLSLNVGKVGFVSIQNLSAGQRCVAVFPLLLRDKRGPLMIDQPEDNLDNRHIADVIAPDIVKQKQEQQFLVTSHNANLVVLTDADLICHVDSDGATCTFPTAGFLACARSVVKKAVLDVLDGGEAALGARQRKYGL